METNVVYLQDGCGFTHTLPAVVRDATEQPLYIAIALWGLRSSQLLTTENVSRAFSVTQGRARDILHYISHEGRGRITSERLILHTGITGNTRRRALRVVQVNTPALVKGRGKRPRRPPRPVSVKEVAVAAGPDELQILRRWMCQRRPGDICPPLNGLTKSK
ncbi:CaiF/GrlA family transcriptional regulator [Salmonella enterica subsp. enterica]|nr:CaiF/GrlA family transcriptional regulator [Salmonella enterica subsp. enterica serovar Glostrup]ECO3214893.1 CaiF/GrlA family transcriptional regulator [Salmonella enterica subsp. enterica serovar Give]EDA3040928.1 CaiF/GrlA family transcriptional regulator [Salmonella enterica subsp. enterica serovar Poona]